MKSVLILFLVISLGMFPNVSATSTYDPGLITADSPLWKADIVLEEIMERFMWSDNARVELQLKHANERIGEMQANPGLEIVTDQYVKVLNRIQNAENVRYQTATMIQAQLENHNSVLTTISEENSVPANQAIAQLTQTRNVVQEKTSVTITAEQQWWSETVPSFGISSTSTEIADLGDYKEYTMWLTEGVTSVEVLRSDGVLMESYIIRNEQDIITIQTGTTENYVNKYTFTINELQKYEAMV